jgi:hypothetical protein
MNQRNGGGRDGRYERPGEPRFGTKMTAEVVRAAYEDVANQIRNKEVGHEAQEESVELKETSSGVLDEEADVRQLREDDFRAYSKCLAGFHNRCHASPFLSLLSDFVRAIPVPITADELVWASDYLRALGVAAEWQENEGWIE